MQLNELQQGFKSFLLGGSREGVESALAVGISPERLGIYQRNVLGSLVDTLIANFPATTAFMGEERFRGTANGFVRAHPPEKAALWAYGEELVEFLARRDHESASNMARLEWALTKAYFAARQPPLAVERLVSLPPESVPNITLVFASMVSIFPCPETVVSAFRRWREGEKPEPASSTLGDQFLNHHVLTAREEGEIYHKDLPGWKGVFLARLYKGESFGLAANWALRIDPDADLQGALGEALANNLIVDFTIV